MPEIQEEEIDLREYINVLIKRKSVIILIFLIVVIAATLVSYFVLTPIYQSSVSFQVNIELIKQSYYYPASSVNPYISDILILLTSDSILREAAEGINLDYKYGEIREKVEATNIKDTNIITLTVEDKDPKIAKDLANSIVKVFIEKNQFIYDEKRKIAEENLKIYEEQLDDVEKNVIEIEKTKQKVAT
jgi:capsular polysaccharide biosynthesis protein